jgi:hypothetical protein
MNQDQISSLTRSVMKVIAGLLAAHGLQNEATWMNTPDVISAVLLAVSLAWSHFAHQSPPSSADGGTPKSGGGATLMAFLLAAELLLNAGCHSTPQQAAYRAAGTTIVSVDTVMNLWGAYVAANHPGVAAETKVETAYEKYQAAMVAVCDAGVVYSATGSTNAPAGTALNQAVANASQDLSDLSNLITSFGIKIN